MSESHRHHAIQFCHKQHSVLESSSRKKSLKAQLVRVTKGEILIRLGKLEYCVSKGELFWIPANCLVSTTAMPNTQIQAIEISQRVTTRLPTQSGYLTKSSLLTSLMDRLASEPALPSDYLGVALHELSLIKTTLPRTKTSATNVVAMTKLDKNAQTYLAQAMAIRDANKQKLSGKKKELIEAELKQLLGESYAQHWLHFTGHQW